MIDQQYNVGINAENVKVFNALIEAISAICSEIRLKLTPKGIEFCAMDGSHICLIAGLMAKEDLDRFLLGEPIELGLNIEDLVKILKRNTKDSISLKPGEGKSVDIVFTPENAKKVRTFNMALIDIDVEEINMDSLMGMEFDNTFKIHLDQVNEVLKDAEIYSEVLGIKNQGNTLIFNTEGSIGKYKNEIESEELIESHFTNNCEGSFALQFLKSIMKVGNIYGTTSSAGFKQAFMEAKFKSEAPLYMKFNVMEYGKIIYYLAPRVEEDPYDPYGESESKKTEPAKTESPAQVPAIPVPTLTFKQFGDKLAAQIKLEGFNAQMQESMKYIKVMENDKNALKQKMIDSEGKDFDEYKKVYDTISNTLREEKRDLEEMKDFMGKH